MKSYFKAIHSSGTVHLRASQSGRPYAWAEVGARVNHVSFASKRPGKLSKYAGADAEIVPVETITVAEYNQLLKANKNGCSTVFLGKTYKHTDSVQKARAVCAVGIHYPYKETKVKLKALDPADKYSVDAWARHPEGFWMNVNNESTRVHFYSNRSQAEEIAQRYKKVVDGDWSHCPDIVEILDVVQA